MINVLQNNFQILTVTKENASHVATVFRSVYGDDFPLKYVYQPDSLWTEIEEGRLVAALAFSEAGQAVGYIALYQTAPNPRLWEAGNMIVDPAYKLTNVSSLLASYYFDPAFCKSHENDGLFSEAVCCHYFTQVNGSKAGLTDCALELEQLDGDSFKDSNHNKDETKRVSCIFSILEFNDPPNRMYLPEIYAAVLQDLSKPLRSRYFQLGTAPLPDTGVTIWEDKYYESAQTWKIAVHKLGADWSEFVDGLLSKALQRQVISLQITVNTACPQISIAVEELRNQGFFLGGLIPRWFGTDGILMQKIVGSEPDYDGIKLYTQTAKKLLALIRADEEEVRKLVEKSSNHTSG